MTTRRCSRPYQRSGNIWGNIRRAGIGAPPVEKNIVVAVADIDVLRAANPAQIAAAKATVAESMKAAIFLDGANGQNYK